MSDKSAWVELRDSIVGNLTFDTVTEDMKQAFNTWLLETCMPMAEEAAEDFVGQIKDQAKNELGWCKIRDLIVLPFIIKGGLWFVQKALTKTQVK